MRLSQTATAAAMLLALSATAAEGQAVVPRPTIEGLIERPEGWQPLPLPRPDPFALYASGCTPPDPELAWAALPRDLREVPFAAMVGQLLIVSFSGKTADAPGVLLARDALRNGRIGGLLAFRHNVGSAADLRAVNALFAEAHPALPAIVAVDQEGGAVARIRPENGAPATPAARTVAAGTADEAADHYRAMADSLADLGFTANFGPVVDLEVNPDNPVVAAHGRAYGADPATVASFARTFVAAHQNAGVATALKHFPGHGSSTADSHDGAIDLTATWSPRELIPFRDLLSGERPAEMVMIGHLALPGLSGPDGLPASLSPEGIDRFLRKTLCYDGLVVSDDFAMEAVSDRWPAPEAVRLMIEAGGDLALLSLPSDRGMALVDEVIAEVTDAAARSPAFAAKLRAAYARVVHHKLDLAEHRRVSVAPQATPVRLATLALRDDSPGTAR